MKHGYLTLTTMRYSVGLNQSSIAMCLEDPSDFVQIFWWFSHWCIHYDWGTYGLFFNIFHAPPDPQIQEIAGQYMSVSFLNDGLQPTKILRGSIPLYERPYPRREDSICGRIFAHFYSGQPCFFFYPVADVDHSALDDAFKLISIKKCQGIFWVPSRASPT